ncbi:ATP-binding cassette domain-containing protein [Clostridium sp. D2Q-11]|uniref:ATP-binding cassette domain-containing protein n=1 Tax=Anaeromonas frigoriresistens TaxID=2683708 RepID=A0A942UXA1_9FIRM|nr:ATP-binding cassette domain-containing protein [Anaeromonas frigoriresistens]
MFKLDKVKYKNILNIDNLHIKEGIITCLLGESGSGKTTLLRLLNDLISPTEGSILYKNKNIVDMNPVELRRKVLMLGQTPITFEGTIRENFNMALEFSEKEKAEDDILQKYLDISNLNKSLDHNAKEMSGGERQRLALARVLLLDGEVLLLDEPSSALDEDTEKFVIESVVKYAKDNNKSVIMVTHSSLIAKEYGDEIIRMNKGGTIDE